MWERDKSEGGSCGGGGGGFETVELNAWREGRSNWKISLRFEPAVMIVRRRGMFYDADKKNLSR